MISVRHASEFCCEDLSNIENYDKAVKDERLWDCHHRDEIKVLPSGIKVCRTTQDLKDNGRYFNCPANELIFILHTEHARMHMTGKLKGCKMTDEQRTKISSKLKGKPRSAETKMKISMARRKKT